MEMITDLNALKQAIIEREVIGNILVKTSGSYHVVTGSVIDFWNDEYIFHFEGFGFHLEINDIKSFILIG